MDSFLNKEKLPNAQAALTLGIVGLSCAIVLSCCCYGLGSVIGIVCGILALMYGGKAVKEYMANKEKYEEKDYKTANAGRILGIITVVVAALMIISIIIIIIVAGVDSLNYQQMQKGRWR